MIIVDPDNILSQYRIQGQSDGTILLIHTVCGKTVDTYHRLDLLINNTIVRDHGWCHSK